MDTNPGGWEPDPYQRAKLRWHDGTGWTANVSDGVAAWVESTEGPTPETFETTETPKIPRVGSFGQGKRTNGWLIAAGVLQILMGFDISRVGDGSSLLETLDNLYRGVTGVSDYTHEGFGAGGGPDLVRDVMFVALGLLLVIAGGLCAWGKVRAGVYTTIVSQAALLTAVCAGVVSGLVAGTYQSHFVEPVVVAVPVVTVTVALIGLRLLRRRDRRGRG